MRLIRWTVPVVVLVALATVPTLARAATAATVSVTPTSAPAGATLTARGAHFGAGESVDLSVDGTRLATAKAGSGGSFSGKHLTVPASAKPGKHTVRAAGRTSHRSATATVTVTPPVDWAQFRAGPAHTGVNPDETVLTPATVGKLKLRFSLDAPAGLPGVEVGGVAYWDLGSQVTAFDPVTGAVRWRAVLGVQGTPSAPLAAGGGRIFVGTARGGLVALDAADGTTAWTRGIDVNPIRSAPTLAGGVLYAMGDDRSDRLQAIALDPATGAVRWQTMLEGAVTLSSVTVSGGLVFVGTGIHPQLYALDAATGAVRWHVAVANGNQTALAADGRLYTIGRDDAGNGFVDALDPATGRVLWSAPGSGTLAVTGRAVYVLSGTGTAFSLRALDPATGATLWTSPPVAETGTVSGPVVAGGVVYVNGSHLYALDATDGTLLWTGSTTGSGEPVVVNGEVLVPVRNADFTTTLRAYRP